MICGVLYAVGVDSGVVDYSFNTNSRRHKSKSVTLPFDDSRDHFLRHKPVAIAYNPREQLLYSWDSVGGKAIQYKLHFDGKDPSEGTLIFLDLLGNDVCLLFRSTHVPIHYTNVFMLVN